MSGNAAVILDPRQLIQTEPFTPFWSEGMTAEEYHNDRTFISSTNLRLAHPKTGSLKAFHYAQFRRKPTVKKEPEHFRIGRILHKATLEGPDFRKRYVVEPVFQGYTQGGELTTSLNCKAVKEARAEWYANLSPEQIVVTEDDLEVVTGLAENLLEHPEGPYVFADGKPEVAGFFIDEETQLRLKFMPDFLSFTGDRLVDLKSAKDGGKRRFGSAAFEHRYDIQLYMYACGVKALTGRWPDVIVNVVVEKTRPYEIAIYYYLMEDLYQAKEDYHACLRNIRKAIDTNQWPMRQKKIERIHTPNWFIYANTMED